jgi:hypothetical protein
VTRPGGPDDGDGEPVRPSSEPHPAASAEEWGRRQAETAPPWSDAKWRRICALLRIDVAPPA